MLWMEWTKWCRPLRAACTRKRTFLWMGAALIGFSVRGDLLGVTSFVRVLGLDAMYYDRLLDLFHSPALRLADLTRLWARLVLAAHPGIERCGGMAVLVGDGLKVGKAGRKMPGVKKLHQESGSNTKPPFIILKTSVDPQRSDLFRVFRASDEADHLAFGSGQQPSLQESDEGAAENPPPASRPIQLLRSIAKAAQKARQVA